MHTLAAFTFLETGPASPPTLPDRLQTFAIILQIIYYGIFFFSNLPFHTLVVIFLYFYNTHLDFARKMKLSCFLNFFFCKTSIKYFINSVGSFFDFPQIPE